MSVKDDISRRLDFDVLSKQFNIPTYSDKELKTLQATRDKVDKIISSGEATDRVQAHGLLTPEGRFANYVLERNDFGKFEQDAIDKLDPNSELNRGRAVTVADLEADTKFSRLINTGANVLKNIGEDVLPLFVYDTNKQYQEEYGNFSGSEENFSSISRKLNEGKKLLGDRDEYFAKLDNQVALGLIGQGVADTSKTAYNEEISKYDLTKEEIDTLGKTSNDGTKSNSEVIEELNRLDTESKEEYKDLYKYLGGERLYNPVSFNKFYENIKEDLKPSDDLFTGAAKDYNEGNYFDSSVKSAKAIGDVLSTIAVEAVKNPSVAAEFVIGEAGDVIMPTIIQGLGYAIGAAVGSIIPGVGTVATSATIGATAGRYVGEAQRLASSIARSKKQLQEGLVATLQQEGGKAFSQEAQNELWKKELLYASADYIGELASVKGFTKALRSTGRTEAQLAVEVAERVSGGIARSVSNKTMSMLGKIGKKALPVGQAALSEGTAETIQGSLEQFGFQNRDPESFKEMFIQGGLGALAGGGMVAAPVAIGSVAPALRAVRDVAGKGSGVVGGAANLAGKAVGLTADLAGKAVGATLDVAEKVLSKPRKPITAESTPKEVVSEVSSISKEASKVSKKKDVDNDSINKITDSITSVAEHINTLIGSEKSLEDEFEVLATKYETEDLSPEEDKRAKEIEDEINVIFNLKSQLKNLSNAKNLLDNKTVGLKAGDTSSNVDKVLSIAGTIKDSDTSSESILYGIKELGETLPLVLGSHDITPEQIKSISDSLGENTTEEINALLNTTLERVQAQEKVSNAKVSKKLQRVHGDIVNGGKDGDREYLGVKDYLSMMSSTDANIQKTGMKSLVEFANRHRAKADTLQAVYDSVANKTDLSKENKDRFDTLNSMRSSPYYITNKSKGFVEHVRKEADLLEATVAQGEVLLGEELGDIDTNITGDSIIPSSIEYSNIRKNREKQPSRAEEDVKKKRATKDTKEGPVQDEAPLPESETDGVGNLDPEEAPPIEDSVSEPSDTDTDTKEDKEEPKDTDKEEDEPVEPVETNKVIGFHADIEKSKAYEELKGVDESLLNNTEYNEDDVVKVVFIDDVFKDSSKAKKANSKTISLVDDALEQGATIETNESDKGLNEKLSGTRYYKRGKPSNGKILWKMKQNEKEADKGKFQETEIKRRKNSKFLDINIKSVSGKTATIEIPNDRTTEDFIKVFNGSIDRVLKTFGNDSSNFDGLSLIVGLTTQHRDKIYIVESGLARLGLVPSGSMTDFKTKDYALQLPFRSVNEISRELRIDEDATEVNVVSEVDSLSKIINAIESSIKEANMLVGATINFKASDLSTGQKRVASGIDTNGEFNVYIDKKLIGKKDDSFLINSLLNEISSMVAVTSIVSADNKTKTSLFKAYSDHVNGMYADQSEENKRRGIANDFGVLSATALSMLNPFSAVRYLKERKGYTEEDSFNDEYNKLRSGFVNWFSSEITKHLSGIFISKTKSDSFFNNLLDTIKSLSKRALLAISKATKKALNFDANKTVVDFINKVATGRTGLSENYKDGEDITSSVLKPVNEESKADGVYGSIKKYSSAALNIITTFFTKSASKSVSLYNDVTERRDISVPAKNFLYTNKDAISNLRVAIDNKELDKEFVLKFFDGFIEEDDVTEGTIESIKGMVKFVENMNSSLISISNTSGRNNARYKDLINYLYKDSQGVDIIPEENVFSAMSLVAYNWLATQGRGTLVNDERAIRGVFSMNNSDPVSNKFVNALRDIGLTTQGLSESLGRSAVSNIGIRAGDRAIQAEQSKLELSVGNSIIKAMSELGYVQELFLNKSVYAELRKDLSPRNNSPIGLKDLMAKAKKLRVVPKDGGGVTSFTKITYVDGKNKDKPSRENFEVEKNYRKDFGIYDSIMNVSISSRSVHVKPLNNTEKQRKMHNGQYASVVQSANLSLYESHPFIANKYTSVMYNLLGDEGLKKMLGYVDLDDPNILKNTLKDDIIEIEGKNLSILRDIESYKELVSIAKGNKKNGFKLWFASAFWSTGRMGMLSGRTSNPQASWMLRSVLHHEDHEQSLDLNEYNDRHLRFLEAVALGLGISIPREGNTEMFDFYENNILRNIENIEGISGNNQERKTLFQKAYASILYGFENQNTDNFNNDSINPDILNAVNHYGEESFSLNALVNYSMYKDAIFRNKSSVRLNIGFESDGNNNGPAILQYELGGSFDVNNTTVDEDGNYIFSEDQLAKDIVRDERGLFFYSENTETDALKRKLDPNTLDQYQSFGSTLTRYLAELITGGGVEPKDDKEAVMMENNASMYKLLSSMLPPFVDISGFISKEIRNIMKNPSMILGYGAGVKRVVSDFHETIFNEAFKRDYLEKALILLNSGKKEESKEVLLDFIKTINGVFELVNTKYSKAPLLTTKQFLDDKGILSAEKIASFEFTEIQDNSIAKAIRYTYGKAIEKAVDDIYSDVSKNRKTLIAAVDSSVDLFSLIFKKELDRVASEHNRDNKDDFIDYETFGYTNGLINKALTNVSKAYPWVNTLFQKEAGEDEIKRGYNPIEWISADLDLNTAEVMIDDYGVKLSQEKVNEINKRNLSRDPRTVHSEFDGGTKQYKRLFSYPTIKSIASRGLRNVLLMNINVDATIANKAMGTGVQFLNTHDGFTIGTHQVREQVIETNRITFETLRNFSYPEEITTTLLNTHKEFRSNHNAIENIGEYTDLLKLYTKAIKSMSNEHISSNSLLSKEGYDKTIELLNEHIANAEAMDTRASLGEYMFELERVRAEEVKEKLSSLMNDFANMSNYITSYKNYRLDRVTSVGQYYAPDAYYYPKSTETFEEEFVVESEKKEVDYIEDTAKENVKATEILKGTSTKRVYKPTKKKEVNPKDSSVASGDIATSIGATTSSKAVNKQMNIENTFKSLNSNLGVWFGPRANPYFSVGKKASGYLDNIVKKYPMLGSNTNGKLFVHDYMIRLMNGFIKYNKAEDIRTKLFSHKNMATAVWQNILKHDNFSIKDYIGSNNALNIGSSYNHYLYPTEYKGKNIGVKAKRLELVKDIMSTMYPDIDKSLRDNNTKGLSIFPQDIIDTILDDYSIQAKVTSTHTDTNIVSIGNKVESASSSELNSHSESYFGVMSDYTAKNVDSKNIAEVSNELVRLSNGKQPSENHSKYLDSLMDNIFTKVVQPMKLLYSTSKRKGSRGKVTFGEEPMITLDVGIGGDVVEGSGIIMSLKEVLSHELVHAIVNTGLNIFSKERRDLTDLYNYVLNHGLTSSDLYSDNMSNTDMKRIDSMFNYIFPSSSSSRNNSLQEFVAHGITNELFRDALANIPYNEESLEETSILRKIINKFNSIMSRLFSVKREANVAAELDRLFYLLSKKEENRKIALYNALDKTYSSTDKMFSLFKGAMQNALPEPKAIEPLQASGSYVSDNIKLISSRLPNIMLHYMKGKTVTIDNLIDFAGEDGLNKIRRRLDKIDEGIGVSLMREIKSRTRGNGFMHDLLRMKNKTIDSARDNTVSAYMQAFKKMFNNSLTDIEKSSLTKSLLQTGSASLLKNGYSLDEVTNMLSDESYIKSEIDTVLLDLKRRSSIKKYVNFYIKASASLGHYMATGRPRFDLHYNNAKHIVSMNNTMHQGKLDSNIAKEIEPIVDKLTSLYAMAYTDSSEFEPILPVIKNYPEDIKKVLRLHNVLNDSMVKDVYGETPMLSPKGYIKTILQDNKTLAVYDKAWRGNDELTKDYGFAQTESTMGVKEGLDIYVSNYAEHPERLAGAIAATNLPSTGVRAKRGIFLNSTLKHNGYTANQKETLEYNKTKNAYFTDTSAVSLEVSKIDRYVPDFDSNGIQYGLHLEVAHEHLDMYLERYNNFDNVLAATAGSMVASHATIGNNNKVVRALFDDYEQNIDVRPDAFVYISNFSDNEEHVKLYNTLPDSTKDLIYELSPNNSLPVRKELLDTALGYYKYSLKDSFFKDKSERTKFDKAVVYVLTGIFGKTDRGVISWTQDLETFMRESSAYVKNNIVTRTLMTTVGNTISNNLCLMASDVSIKDISVYQKEAFHGAKQHAKDMTELKALNLSLLTDEMTKDERKHIQRKITAINDSLNKNPTSFLIDSGMLATIVDDIDTGNVESPFKGMIEGWIEKKTALVPDKIKDAGKFLMMHEDTDMYKILNNAVMLSDFVGRYTLYRHLTLNENYSHDDALGKVMDVFVNFELPTHKSIQWLNDHGFLFFSKYNVRILKTIFTSIFENPAGSLKAVMLSNFLNAPYITDSLPVLGKNPLSMFGTPLTTLPSSLEGLLTTSVPLSIAQ